MNTEQTLETIPVGTLLERVRALRARDYRLVQICATALPGQLELTYSFDLEGRLASLRVQISADNACVPSICPVYGSAFLYENEMHDLFNVRVEGMAVDFHGALYKTAVKFAFGATRAPAATVPPPALPAS